MFRNVFWRVANSTNYVYFTRYENKMQDLDPVTREHLKKKGPKHFCILFFKSVAGYSSMGSNIAEIFNGNIIEVRYKPTVIILKEMYNSIITRILARKN